MIHLKMNRILGLVVLLGLVSVTKRAAAAPAIHYPSNSLQVYSGQVVNIIPQFTGLRPGQTPQCMASRMPFGLKLDFLTCAITGTVSNNVSLGGQSERL